LYEFLSQIVDYDDKDLEKLSLYARHLRSLLHEEYDGADSIALDNIVMSHYRLSKIRQQDISLQKDNENHGLKPSSDVGSGKAKDQQEEFLSQILSRLNELFLSDNLSDKDLINYAYTVRDKIAENSAVMSQIINNSPEQAMLGNYPQALDNAILDSHEAHQEQMIQLLSDTLKNDQFKRVVFDLLKQNPLSKK
jgi:type I restriction enzyme R subunit